MNDASRLALAAMGILSDAGADGRCKQAAKGFLDGVITEKEFADTFWQLSTGKSRAIYEAARAA